MQNLIELHMPDNFFERMPRELGDLDNIRILDLSGNPKLPLDSTLRIIADINNLESLFLRRSEYREIPSSIRAFGSLRNLYLDMNSIVEVPPDIARLTSLEELGLSDNEISKLPDNLQSMVRLKSLNIRENKLSGDAGVLCSLTNLQTLDISENLITRLPDELDKLKNLKTISASHNRISSIGSELFELPNLETANFDNNPIVSVKAGTSKPEKLKYLGLREAAISEFDVNPRILNSLGKVFVTESEISPDVKSYLSDNKFASVVSFEAKSKKETLIFLN